MSLMSILESLATTVPHRTTLDGLLKDQPQSVRAAFKNQSGRAFREQLPDNAKIPAHRSSVVSIKTQ